MVLRQLLKDGGNGEQLLVVATVVGVGSRVHVRGFVAKSNAAPRAGPVPFVKHE
jgi:primosomal replication protein N